MKTKQSMEMQVVGVFHLQKNSENFPWKFPIGKSAFHLDTNPIRSQAQDVLPVN